MPPPRGKTLARGSWIGRSRLPRGGRRDGDVTGDHRAARQGGGEGVADRGLGSDALVQGGSDLLADGGDTGRPVGVRAHGGPGQGGQDGGRVAVQGVVCRVDPAECGRVHVYLDVGVGELQAVVCGLVGAEVGADGDEGVGVGQQCAGGRSGGEVADHEGVVLGNGPTPGVGGEQAGPGRLQQCEEFRSGTARTTAGPDQRATGAAQQLLSGGEFGGIRGGSRSTGDCLFGIILCRVLQIDRPLHAGGAAGHRECRRRSLTQDAPRITSGRDGGRVRRDRAQHAELVLGLVDEAPPAAQVRRLDLPGDVQDGRPGRQCLDQRTGGVARPRAGRGEGAADRAARPSVAVGRVDGGRLVPDRHEAQVPVDGLHEGQVVYGHDAEDGVDAEGFKVGYEEFAPVVVLHGKSPHRMPRPTPPQTSMLVPVMYEARGESSATIT